MILLYNFLQGSTKISNQGTADTSRVHLADLDSGIFQESPVNTDLTELILNENYLLTFKCLFQKFLNKSCLTGSKETGNNVNLYHFVFPLSIIQGTRGNSPPHRDFCTKNYDQEALIPPGYC